MTKGEGFVQIFILQQCEQKLEFLALWPMV